jgi:glycosyltransferase A (GT-A) superfamily protein (DUF2064 family)
VLVLAKAPAPGRSKTRLAPAFGPIGAARLAAAALQDTLAAVAATPGTRGVLVLDGRLDDAGPFGVRVPAGFAVVPQMVGGHAVRIAEALAACRGPALLIGMDTPQVTPELLRPPGFGRTEAADGEAWLGPARDGGWWALGLRQPWRWARQALRDVPMSTPRTGAAQRDRLLALGLRPMTLPALRDVDEPADAAAVASDAPDTRFAAVYRELAGRRSEDAGRMVAGRMVAAWVVAGWVVAG